MFDEQLPVHPEFVWLEHEGFFRKRKNNDPIDPMKQRPKVHVWISRSGWWAQLQAQMGQGTIYIFFFRIFSR